jgi:hypothetical protein
MRLSVLSIQREQLSAKVLEIARGMLKSQQFDATLAPADSHLAETALKWLKKALTLLDGVAEDMSTIGKALKVVLYIYPYEARTDRCSGSSEGFCVH